MDFGSFLRELENIIELDSESLSGNEELAHFGAWDSMAHLSFIAFADEKLTRKVSVEEIKGAKTASELAALVGIDG